MAVTVTVLADHKGYTTPKVSGDEYYVDADINCDANVAAGMLVTAAELGLRTINAVIVTGVEEIGHDARAIVAEGGGYESGSSFKLILSTGTAAQSGTSDEGSVRVRVYGNL